MNYTISVIPPEFVWVNLTVYQRESIILKYKIVKEIDSRPDGLEKEDMFIRLGDEVSLASSTIRDIYYQTKKATNGKS